MLGRVRSQLRAPRGHPKAFFRHQRECPSQCPGIKARARDRGGGDLPAHRLSVSTSKVHAAAISKPCFDPGGLDCKHLTHRLTHNTEGRVKGGGGRQENKGKETGEEKGLQTGGKRLEFCFSSQADMGGKCVFSYMGAKDTVFEGQLCHLPAKLFWGLSDPQTLHL